MSKTVVIDPVTRIEGHAKISIFLDDAGEVSDARFHVVEYRGFEKFCGGRPMWEMAGGSQQNEGAHRNRGQYHIESVTPEASLETVGKIYFYLNQCKALGFCTGN